MFQDLRFGLRMSLKFSDSDCVTSLNDFSVLSVPSVAIFEGGGGLST